MSETTTEIPPVAPGIFTLPPYNVSPPKLVGGYCASCTRHFFPRPKYCPSCLGTPEERLLDSRGVVYSFTVVRTKPPLGLPQPYSIGYVDLEETGLRVFCLLDPGAIDKLRVGLPVQLAVAPLGTDSRGAPCLRPYFTPRTNH